MPEFMHCTYFWFLSYNENVKQHSVEKSFIKSYSFLVDELFFLMQNGSNRENVIATEKKRREGLILFHDQCRLVLWWCRLIVL